MQPYAAVASLCLFNFRFLIFNAQRRIFPQQWECAQAILNLTVNDTDRDKMAACASLDGISPLVLWLLPLGAGCEIEWGRTSGRRRITAVSLW